MPTCAAPVAPEEIQVRVAVWEILVAVKQGRRADQRSASMHALTCELLVLQAALAAEGKDQLG